MKTKLQLLGVLIFAFASILCYGHDGNKAKGVNNEAEKEKHISLEEFPANMPVNHIIGWGGMTVAFNEIPAGTDFSPLLEGLKNNHCQVPHWGYILEGKLHVIYTDGTEVDLKKDDIYYMPPGHTAFVKEDLKFIEFSPQDQSEELMKHIDNKIKAFQNGQ